MKKYENFDDNEEEISRVEVINKPFGNVAEGDPNRQTKMWGKLAQVISGKGVFEEGGGDLERSAKGKHSFPSTKWSIEEHQHTRGVKYRAAEGQKSITKCEFLQ